MFQYAPLRTRPSLRGILCAAMLVCLLVVSIPPAGTTQTRVSAQPEIPGTSPPYMVITPRIGAPAIVVAGSTFQVVMEIPAGDVLTGVVGTLNSTETGWSAGLGHVTDIIPSGPGTVEFLLTVPHDMPYLIYDLQLAFQLGGVVHTALEYNAVAVVREIRSEPTVVHLADFHIGDPRGAAEDLQETIEWKAARRTVEEINLMRPDMVLISGDLVFGQNYIREYPALIEILRMFRVPVFCAMGNHDGYAGPVVDGYDMWTQYIAPLYYSFDYGDMKFIVINSYDWPREDRMSVGFAVAVWGGQVRQEQMNWIRSELESSAGRPVYMVAHHNPLWRQDSKYGTDQNWNGEGGEELISMIGDFGVRAYFAGHVHFDDVTYAEGCAFITSTTAASGHGDGSYWGYRRLSLTRDGAVDYMYMDDLGSIPSYNLESSVETRTGENGPYTVMSVTSRLERAYPIYGLFVGTGRLYGAAEAWRVVHGGRTYTLAVRELGNGTAVFGLGPERGYLNEDIDSGRAYMAPEMDSPIRETLEGVYLQGKDRGDLTMMITIQSDRDVILRRVRIRDEGFQELSVAGNWTRAGGYFILEDVRLSAGTNRFMAVRSEAEPDPDPDPDPNGGDAPPDDQRPDDGDGRTGGDESASAAFMARAPSLPQMLIYLLFLTILILLAVVARRIRTY